MILGSTMPDPSDPFPLRVLSGEDLSARGKLLRGATAIVEPFYATAMRARNLLYSRGVLHSRSLGRPTISVGNLTTGGTGKTPVVRWLAGRLREAGHHPAVLLRGYRSDQSGLSDEQQVHERGLNVVGTTLIPIQANPSRVDAAAQVLQQHGEVDTFVLDDAFQHRKARRDFDLVLISATDPFGYGHVLPRGLLREPMSGLGRADAFLITRAAQADESTLRRIEEELGRRNPAAPIYRADHVHTALWPPGVDERLPVEVLKGERFFAFCGIGNPAAFGRQLQALGGELVGHEWFADHHAYTEADLRRVRLRATAAGANRIVTTEKDWVKITALAGAMEGEPVISVVELGIRFHDGDEGGLFERILAACGFANPRVLDCEAASGDPQRASPS
jgi:tetraacyldisaccharide 4'-kinase